METDFLASMGTPRGIVEMVLAGLAVLFCILWFKHWKFGLRAWESETADILQDGGVPSWALAELRQGAMGNIAGAASAFRIAKSKLSTVAGWAELDGGLIYKAKSDPVRWANIKNIFQAVDSGASQDQVQQMIASALPNSPFGKLTAPPTLRGTLVSDVHGAVSRVNSVLQSNPLLDRIRQDLDAQGQGHLFPLVAAGAQAVTTGAAAGALAGTPGGPVGAAGGAAGGAGAAVLHLMVSQAPAAPQPSSPQPAPQGQGPAPAADPKAAPTQGT